MERLRLLRQAHLAYVDAHSERLKAGLNEYELHRHKVVQEMDCLEQEVIELLEKSSQQEIE